MRRWQNGDHLRRGTPAWAAKRERDLADDGSGWVYAVTNVKGVRSAFDLTKIGKTRNTPVSRALVIIETAGARLPTLWACHSANRHAAEQRVHLLLDDYRATERTLIYKMESFRAPLPVVLAVFAKVFGFPAEEYEIKWPTTWAS